MPRYKPTNVEQQLGKREDGARKLTAQLNAAVHDVLRLQRAYEFERAEQDRIARPTAHAPIDDGPPLSHPWEDALRHLKRAVGSYPEIEPPLARINRDYRQTEREREDALKRHLRQEREERDAKRKARADSGFIY